MKGTSRILLVAVLVFGLLVGLSSIGAQPEKRVLRITEAWPTYIDPAVGSDYSSSTSFVNLYDTLIYPTPTGNVIPHVAKDWDISPDGLTYTFYLREGIKFHDGKELTAEDVAFSMNRIITIGEGYAYLFEGKVESSKALDKYTVQFKLKAPFGPFLTALVRLYILNKDCVMANIKKPGPYGDLGDYGKEYLLTHDCGSGPYKVKEFPLAEYVLMERFPDYWRGIDPYAPDEFKFIGTTEPVTIRTMMARRELEISDQWQPLEGFEALDKMEGIDVAKYYAGTVLYIMLHNRKPPTDDIHFRKALSWAMDYKTVVEKLFPGARQAVGPVSFILPGHNPDVFQYYQDFDKAREELKKSKYYAELDKYPVDLVWVSEVPDEEKIALLLQANAAQVGIKVNVIKKPWLSVVEETGRLETTANAYIIFVAPHYAEAGSLLESRYHSRSTGTWEQTEWLQDPEIDRMIEDAIATIDREERMRKYREIQEKILELTPSIFLFDQPEKHAYQAAYIYWPAAEGVVIPVMGYNHDVRFIQVFPEKREKLLKK